MRKLTNFLRPLQTHLNFQVSLGEDNLGIDVKDLVKLLKLAGHSRELAGKELKCHTPMKDGCDRCRAIYRFKNTIDNL